MKFVLVVLCTLWSASNTALAHSPLASTEPDALAQLSQAPKAIVLNFTKKARVTKVTISKDAAAEENDVKLKLPGKKFVQSMSLPSPITGAGVYRVKWRALSADGHAITGRFQFTVTGN